MPRHKDANWDVSERPNTEAAMLTVLMDIRDELKRINSILNCTNFLEVPRILRTIRGNTGRIERKKADK